MASLNPNLSNFWFDGEPCDDNFIKCRHRVLYGGRASSKSWEFAGMAAYISATYRTRFLCVRRFQNKIKESVYSLISAQIERFGFDGFDVQAANIYHQNGSDFSFYGIERNVDEIKSFEGADVLWIEEAHNLTKEQWDVLEPTIRKEGSEIWISFNPRLVTDFVYQRFIVNTPKNSVVRLINYDENGFLSQTMKNAIEEKREEDEEEYQHIYKGVPKSDDDYAIIKRTWIDAAIDAHAKLGIDMSGDISVGYDVADSGADKNAIVVANGSLCVDMDEWKGGEDELRESALRAWSHVGRGYLVYDSIGVGAHVGSTLQSIGHASRYFKFNAGGAVEKPHKEYSPAIKNGEKFENLKAQAWQNVADRFRNTYNAIHKGMKFDADKLISIDGSIKDLEQLKYELSTPHKKYSKRGFDMVETKDELKKRDIPSPNKADAFVMAFSLNLVKKIAIQRPETSYY